MTDELLQARVLFRQLFLDTRSPRLLARPSKLFSPVPETPAYFEKFEKILEMHEPAAEEGSYE